MSKTRDAWVRLKDTWHGWWAIHHASKFADHALSKGQPYLALKVAKLIDEVSIRGDRIDHP